MPRIPRLAPGQVIPLRVRPEDLGTGRGDYASARTADEFAQVAASIAEAEIVSRADRFAAEQTKAAYDLAGQLEQDPDYDTAEQRFTEATEQMVAEGKKSFRGIGRERIEGSLSPALERLRHGIRSHVVQRRVDAGRADQMAEKDTRADVAGRAKTPEERDAQRRAFAESTGRRMASGIISAQEAERDLVEFDREIAMGDFEEMKRTDPKAALLRLQDPTDPLSQLFSEADRQVAISQAAAAYEADLREQEATHNRMRIEQDRVDRELAEAAGKDAEDLIGKKDWPALAAHLKANREVMSLDQYAHYSRALNGTTGETSRPVYSTFQRAIAAGAGTIEVQGQPMPILNAIEAAYLSDDIDQDDRDRLVKSSRETRFGAAKARLARRFTGPAGGPSAQGNFSSAMDEFMEWEQNNPSASAEEATIKESEIGRRWEFISFSDFPSRLPVPIGSTARPQTLAEVQVARDALKATIYARHGLTAASPKEEREAALDSDPDFDRDDEALDEYQSIFQRLEQPAATKNVR